MKNGRRPVPAFLTGRPRLRMLFINEVRQISRTTTPPTTTATAAMTTTTATTSIL
jgi:hypothetical protein